ncbi:extensin precursor [Iris pallida]|uniref:Extensin n=1 Tax=Iris pallida TaxID=29817 RepID=A0AAX6GTE7_IRIPA|nr:extensin precursor [Iris pallida]
MSHKIISSVSKHQDTTRHHHTTLTLTIPDSVPPAHSTAPTPGCQPRPEFSLPLSLSVSFCQPSPMRRSSYSVNHSSSLH